MPKVSKIKLTLVSQYGENYDVWYNAKNKPGFSVSGLPSDFNNVTDFKSSGFSTESELSKALYSAVAKYKESKKTSKKVIIYSASASAELTMNKLNPGSYCGNRSGVSDKLGKINGETAAFGFSYKVKMEVDHTNEKVYHDINDDGSLSWASSLSHKYQVIEWTPERESFFENIYVSMGELVLKISNFIDKDSESLSLLITNNQKLLQ